MLTPDAIGAFSRGCARSAIILLIACAAISNAANAADVRSGTGTAGDTHCTRDTGPIGIAPASWSGTPGTPPALLRHGFDRVGFIARDGKQLTAHVYRPRRFDAARGPLWFVMHGAERDAARYLDASAPVAERHQALAIVIEFSRRDYPTGDDYTLGVTTRGRADESAARERRWRAPDAYLYYEVERLFEAIRLALGGTRRGYYLFGHSAGAQFTHRLLTFLPCARVLGAVAANAGWYTLPMRDDSQRFGMPYSLRGAPPEAADQRALLAAPLTVLLGTSDTREPAADRQVRDTSGAMAQGSNRLARGRYYFEAGNALARALGTQFAWRLVLVPGAGHDVRQVIGSAGCLLFASTEDACLAMGDAR